MTELLRVATSVGTPLAVIGLLVAVAYMAYARRLKYEEKKIAALPEKERATRTDESLTRYGINGKGLSPADKLALIRDEMDKRYRRSERFALLAAVVAVVLFALAVTAYILKPEPAPPPPAAHAPDVPRSPPPLPPGVVEAKIVTVSDVKPTGDGDRVMANVRFEAQVPNRGATFVGTLPDGRVVKLPLMAIGSWIDNGKEKLVLENEPTGQLRAGPWSPREKGFTYLDLRGAIGRVQPPAQYEVVITSVSDVKSVGEGDGINAKIAFSGEVPNGRARMTCKLLDGRTIELVLLSVVTITQDGKEVVIKEGMPTTVLRTQWSPNAIGFSSADLIGAKAHIYSLFYPLDGR